ncbi:MAG: NAD-dependent epimerase/dehydratase family protein [bacterium]
MAKNTVLIAGASGLVGLAAMRHFASLADWDVIGISRRSPPNIPGARFISLDLMDAEACRAATSEFGGVTHLVYAALFEKPGLFGGWLDADAITMNATMLQNLFEPLSVAATGLRHVSLLHGTKAYGLHHPSIGPRGVKIPLRERAPRAVHPNFYFVQEDYLRAKQSEGARWAMTVFRPTVIYGDAWGNNMNPLPVIAAYGALLRDAGEPLHFPGRSGHPVVREAVDAGLVAEALAWAAESASASGGTFNLTNGDVFMWENIWPAIADELGMEVGEPRPESLATHLPQMQDAWAALVARHGLAAPPEILDFVGANSLVYTDMVLAGSPAASNPILNSTIAARQAGFERCLDTEDMFRDRIRSLVREGVIPPASADRRASR